MLTASRPSSRKMSTAAETISSAARSKSDGPDKVSGSWIRYHVKDTFADDGMIGEALHGTRELVEGEGGSHRAAQPSVTDQIRQLLMDPFQLGSRVSAGEHPHKGRVRNNQLVHLDFRP